ncbi:CCR4-NOT transcription complex subunit 9-like isoform X2 [Dioscorea cayenensis subsp. rotundata]|uniref:CCR4-NOT transcription complex subunit 9-like isoform X2 n=1 Tax=Dioscorea cayennensis subsp. rotundata TaxID=55577 RepID=A0AB40BND1_DIOCR|nr:CCR4-NOT transcription complex subunit 9-like isoform X2 [Dioscorea cayenensis subsp. rotundata]
MANLPQGLSLNTPFGSPPPSSPIAAGTPQPGKERKMASAEQLVLDLCDPELRENALLDLSKKREIFQDLAPLLWHSFGTIAALLQEIVSIYPALSPPTLTPVASNRVCNALALLQVDDTEVISFLLQTEIIPLCLRTMEMGSELSKTVATFIVQKILLDDIGLRYICATAERFYAVGSVLATMVATLAEQPSTRLLKHIIRCYLRLSDNQRACEALQNCLPDMLKDGTFNNCLRDDPATRRWLQQLLHNVAMGSPVPVGMQTARLDHMMGN